MLFQCREERSGTGTDPAEARRKSTLTANIITYNHTHSHIYVERRGEERRGGFNYLENGGGGK